MSWFSVMLGVPVTRNVPPKPTASIASAMGIRMKIRNNRTGKDQIASSMLDIFTLKPRQHQSAA